MTLSSQLLSDKKRELAQRLGIDPALILAAQGGRGLEIRVPATVDGALLVQAFILTLPHVGMFDRIAEEDHHLLRIYDLQILD